MFSAMKRLRVDVWSDVACPWCYIGKRRLEAALADFPHTADVTVVWHSFELDPSSPRSFTDGQSMAQRLAKKYGRSVREAEGMVQNVADTAKLDGLEFRFDRIKPGNTFDAHRLIHLGKAEGKQDAVKERMMRAYFTEGEAVGEKATLAQLGVSAGLDADQVAAVLESDQYANDVREDEAEAAEVGIRGVPFFVFGEKYAVSGAQPKEVLHGALTKAWDELGPTSVVNDAASADGAVCGPDGC
jgi:predicted DsbA family dithiol-disulfide isomerase